MKAKYLLVSIFTIYLLLPSCQSEEVLEENVQSAGYYQLRSFIESEIEQMKADSVQLKKVFVINSEQDEQIVDTPDLDLELMIFKLADIDNILFEGKYDISKDGTKSITYEATDDGLRTRKLIVKYEPYFENVIAGMPNYRESTILIERKVENLIYTTEEKLTYTPGKGYVIDYKHDVIFMKPERVRIAGNFVYKDKDVESLRSKADSSDLKADSLSAVN